MDPEWPAIRLHLQSIRQEYDAIHQERAAESDWKRRDQLWKWEMVCLQKFQTALQEWCDYTQGSNDRGSNDGVAERTCEHRSDVGAA
jgi:hypothetical protein